MMPLRNSSPEAEDRFIWRSEWMEDCEGWQKCYEKAVEGKDGDEGTDIDY